MKKNRKSGITLIALIITVIVMLILAGVSISILTGADGLFSQTENAKAKYNNGVEKENADINALINMLDEHLSSVGTETPIVPYEKKADGSWEGAKEVNSPKLVSGMTAIYFNGTDVVELNATDNETEWDKWYDYEAQVGATTTGGTSKWANAITKDDNGNITGYYVWIPRYAYKITSGLGTSTAGNIDIEFLQGTTNKNKDNVSISTEYPNVINNAMEAYVVHPVFTNNVSKSGWDEELPGFWVAKYPAGFQRNTINESGEIQNGSDSVMYSPILTDAFEYRTNKLGQTGVSVSLSYPVFKPLTYMYLDILISDAYRIVEEMKNATAFYNLQNVDTHLMKNSEWGAVVYLTWSKYGRNGIEVNPNQSSITGLYGSSYFGRESHAYNTPIGQLGSSTGNITGIYDLSYDSRWIQEYVMGYTLGDGGSSDLKQNAEICLYEFGEALLTANAKYRTTYKIGGSGGENENWLANDLSEKYGDAILETSSSGWGNSSWNKASSMFIGPKYSTYIYPYLRRGGSNDSDNLMYGGMFAYNSTNGYGGCSFRVALLRNFIKLCRPCQDWCVNLKFFQKWYDFLNYITFTLVCPAWVTTWG